MDTDYLYGITYELGDEKMNEEEIKNEEIDPQLWEHMKDNIKQSFREQNNNFESEHFHNVIGMYHMIY